MNKIKYFLLRLIVIFLKNLSNGISKWSVEKHVDKIEKEKIDLYYKYHETLNELDRVRKDAIELRRIIKNEKQDQKMAT